MLYITHFILYDDQLLLTQLTQYFSPENYRLVNSCKDNAWIEQIKLEVDWNTGQIPIAPKSTISTVLGDDSSKNLILCVFDGEFKSRLQFYSNRTGHLHLKQDK